MSKKQNTGYSRRDFMKTAVKGTVGSGIALAGFPTIVPANVLGGQNAPSNQINVGAIGNGRISRDHDMPGVLRYERARITGVCDLDSKRVQSAKKLVNDYYTKKSGKAYDGVTTYEDYRELLNNKDIDAVLISTPDHWHVIPAIHAVRAGKDVYMQKPASLTIAEGRALSNEAHKAGAIFQIGSQQRSMPQFKKACELVRNGRIGKLQSIIIGLPIDDPKQSTVEQPMPVPPNLNYDMWLGPTPQAFYTEKRVHPQEGFGRPGWLRVEQFGAGMITGWGAHHFDIMNWGMGTEFSGPSEITCKAEFPPKGNLWDVHGPFKSEMVFDNGVKVFSSDSNPNGVKFIGSDGWIFVTRGSYTASSSDPVVQSRSSKALDASDPKILASVIGADEIRLYESKDHHANWLDCVISRQTPITPIEVGHRACTVCLVNHAAMKLGRKLHWDPVNEKFRNDDDANAMLSRTNRWPYVI
jgi:predicted dehydrogenase